MSSEAAQPSVDPSSPRTFVAYVGTSIGAPLLGGQDLVSGKRLEVLWAGSTLAMADQFQDGEIRKLEIRLGNPCLVFGHDRVERFGDLSHARIVAELHDAARRGEVEWDGVVFVDTVDGMEVADVFAVFPRPGAALPSVVHAVKVIGSKWFDPEIDGWRTTPGFGDPEDLARLKVPPLETASEGAVALAACPMLACWFNGSGVRVANALSLAGLASVEDQYPLGHPGQALARDLTWFDVDAYPIERLRDGATVEWFAAERAMWAAEGEADRFDDMLGKPITSPIAVHEGLQGAYTWDGYHRVGASLTDGKFSIPAQVGFRPEFLAESLAQWTVQLERIEAAVRARSVAAIAPSSVQRIGCGP